MASIPALRPVPCRWRSPRQCATDPEHRQERSAPLVVMEDCETVTADVARGTRRAVQLLTPRRWHFFTHSRKFSDRRDAAKTIGAKHGRPRFGPTGAETGPYKGVGDSQRDSQTREQSTRSRRGKVGPPLLRRSPQGQRMFLSGRLSPPEKLVDWRGADSRRRRRCSPAVRLKPLGRDWRPRALRSAQLTRDVDLKHTRPQAH